MNGFKQLKKLASLALMLCMAFQLQAADVDLAKAKNVAKSFMAKQVANGRLRASATSNLKLAKAEPSTFKPDAVDYYIFNADKSYVIVSGDDQAPEILMYGEEGRVDLNNVPPAMQWLLNKYKYQIDGLKAGTLKPNGYTPKATTAVAPLTNANWDQSTPYNNQCPTSGSSRTLTGCPATSLSMCYYVWKWPKTFPAVAAINGSSSGGVSAAALPERTADWDNIIDEYTGPTNKESSNEQKTAVAWLMRYAGQSIPDYMYGTSASGANDPEIYQGVLNMGYTDAKLYTLTELQSSGWGYTNGPQQYTDAQWNEWMLAELHAGNPIEYLAYDCSSYQPAGHAFNVFGCNTSGQYYVNWGWSGDSNGYCTLHNFTTNTGATGQSGSFVFKYGEAMIIGIRPPAGALGPQITVNPTELSFEGYVGTSYTKTFTVTGANLEGDITISNQGSSDFTVSPTTITAANAANGVEVTVTYKPTNVGTASAALTLSSDGADDVTLNVTGTAQAKIPTINVNPASLSFNANLSNTVTKTVNVTGLFLTNNVTVTLNDNNGVFSVSPTTITAANAANGVPVTVSFSSENEGTFTGSLTIASTGAESKTVALTAKANDGGTASDAYLNIAKYATIDDAGWRTALVNNLYKYTEYDEEAWLTLPIYGAWVGASYSTNSSTVGSGHPQTWIQTNVTSKSNAYAGTSWDSNEKLLGSSPYFTSATARAMGYNSRDNTTQETVSFFVTNTTAVQLLGLGQTRTTSTYPATLKVYECTLNADGTLTAGTTAVKSSSNSSTSGTFVLSAKDLDATKIYKVEAATYRSYIAEIGFQTPLNTVGEPVITNVDPSTTTADVTWNPGEDNENWNLRYREYVGSEVATVFFDDFENGLDSWTIYTDGEAVNTNGWYAYSPSGDLGDAYSGSYVASSWSWYNNNAYNADNWLITPQVTLGNEIEFYVRTNAKYPDSYEVLLSTTGKERTDFSVTLQEKVAAPAVSEWSKVSINTSDYKGQTGYIAIRHNDYDENYLFIDDFGIYNSISEWIYANSVTSPCTINSLTSETTYEVQVQGVNSDGKTSTWTISTIFTTLAEAPVTDITLAELVALGEAADGKAYRISDCLLGVYQKDNIIWFKDEVEKTIVLKNETLTVIGGAVDFNEPGDEMNYWIDDIRSKDFDQSNWIEVVFPDAKDYTTEIYTKNLTGVYSYNNGNPKLVITKSVADEDQIDLGSYNPNHYIPANFVGSQNGYFLSMPKAQEYAYFTKAKWDGEKMVMATDASSNKEGFTGSFVIMPVDGLDANTNVGKFYSFNGIVRKTAVSQSPRIKSNQEGYVVETINLNPNNGTVTAISTVGVNGEVKSVKYVNVAGVVSDRPFKGVNIVVTEYTDGSRTTAKVVK